jgi:hypothetical protein
MKYNNYTLSYGKFMAGEFYDETNKEIIVGLEVFLKFDYVFINTKLTDKELKDFTIPAPELIYVEGIGDTRLYELVELVFDKDKRNISLKCHPFIEGKVHIDEYVKFKDLDIGTSYFEISEEEFKRLFFDNYDKIEKHCQQTLSYIKNILT